MTVTPPSVRSDQPAARKVAAEARRAPSEVSDAELLRQTQAQMQRLTQEMQALAATVTSHSALFEGLLTRVVRCLAALGGVVWTAAAAGEFAASCRVGKPPADLGDGRLAVLRELWQRPAAPVIKDGLRAGGLQLFVPLSLGDKTHAIVEVSQRATASQGAQRGYLKFLQQVAEIARPALARLESPEPSLAGEWLNHFPAFVAALHARLDVRHTAYVLVNDARRLASADRITLVWGDGRSARVLAASGVDVIQRRAAAVRCLETLAKRVMKTREALWFGGNLESQPPPLAEALHELQDASQARGIAVIPLLDGDRFHTPGAKPPRIVGALVIENWQSAAWAPATRQVWETVATQGARALACAQEYQSIFLLSLWKFLGGGAWLKQMPTALWLAALLGGVMAALTNIPADFQLAARGVVVPSTRRDIFAATDGVVVEVPIQTGDQVAPGQVLVRMRNTELEVETAALAGRRTTLEQQLAAAQRALVDGGRLSVEEQNRLAGATLELREALAGVEEQLTLLEQRRARLTVRSDVSGEVITWQVKELLHHRPVQRGQVLLSLIDSGSAWELELALPEKRLGHALAAQRAAQARGEPLRVDFMLSTHPGKKFCGEVLDIARRAAADDDAGNVVRVRVAIHRDELPTLSSDTAVTAALQCGKRSLGYVLFQDAWEATQAQWLYWF